LKEPLRSSGSFSVLR